MVTTSPDRTPAPPHSGLGRSGPVAGLLMVVLFVVSFLMMDTPEGDAGDEEWRAYWLDDAHRSEAVVAAFAMALAAIALLWLIGALRRRLAAAPGIDAAYGAGIALAVLMLLASFGAGLIPVGHELGDVPIPQEPDLIRMIDGIYYGTLLLAVPFAVAGLLLTLAVALRGSGLLPRWLQIATVVVGVFALSGPFLALILLPVFLLWMLAFCITLLVRQRRSV